MASEYGGVQPTPQKPVTKFVIISNNSDGGERSEQAKFTLTSRGTIEDAITKARSLGSNVIYEWSRGVPVAEWKLDESGEFQRHENSADTPTAVSAGSTEIMSLPSARPNIL